MKYSQYIIQDDRIIFDFYEFYFSSLRKNKELTLKRIKEVDFQTYPCSMEIDEGEIIFLNHNDEANLKKFAAKHDIPQSNKTDVWMLLCNEYLDTAFGEDEIKKNQETLVNLGISKSEQQEISRRIKWSMFGTMEWNYLGHWDLLAMKQARNLFYRFKNADFYWWTMEIALKGKMNL
jgi:hypothetical protein